jgi:hypothetical protein
VAGGHRDSVLRLGEMGGGGGAAVWGEIFCARKPHPCPLFPCNFAY